MKRKAFIYVLLVAQVCIFQVNTVDAKKFDDKGFKFFTWENPTPSFLDLGFEMKNIEAVIGNTQLLINHKGREIRLWTSNKNKTGGEVKTYKNARFVSSLTIINKPRREVIDFYLDFENYPKYMEQVTEGEVIKSESNNMLVHLKQVYKFLVLTLKADFKYLYTREENGDFSFLLLDGDVGAGAARLEFIPLGENKTLVVNTVWLDVESARFVYRTLVAAQPDMKPTAPLGASAMLTEQIRTGIEKRDLTPPASCEGLSEEPDTPVFANGKIPLDTMRKLSDFGTLVFVHPLQWIKTEKGVTKVEFISSIGQIPGTIEQAKPISSDFSRISEYFKQAKKVEITSVPNGHIMDWNYKFGFGVIGVSMDYTTESRWLNENTVLFKGTKGDIHPLHGAWEWMDLNSGATLLVFTAANQISDDASWVLKLGNKVPNVDILTSLFMGILFVEKQAEWMEAQIKTLSSTP